MSNEQKTRAGRAEKEVLKTSNALKLLGACNNAIIDGFEEKKELLREICRILVDSGDAYRLAWIGYAGEDKEKSVTPVAQCGYEEGYLESLRFSWADSERGRGPAGTAIRTGAACVCNNIETDPDFDSWREDALKRGYAGVAAFPLKNSDKTFGALSICAKEPDGFKGYEFEALQQIANSLSFVINLRRSRQRMAQLSIAVQNTNDWILISDRNGIIEYVNKAVEQITGYKKEELLGRTPRILKSDIYDKAFYKDLWDTILSGNTYTGILTNRKKNGELFEVYHTITPIMEDNGQVSHFVAIAKDITALKQMEAKIYTLAYYDALTGLPNRTLFADRLKQEITRGNRHNRYMGILIIDVDRFHMINEAEGIDAGDAALREIGKRLTEYMRDRDVVARLGSDEFAAALNDLSDTDELIILLEELRKLLAVPVASGGKTFQLTFSMGVAIYPVDGNHANSLMERANMACQAARQQGGNTYLFFKEAMNRRAYDFVFMERRLKGALEKDEFLLHYQPYWDNQTGRMVGMEALIRWQSREEGLVPPGRFISVLEETGLIVEVGEWVFRTAIEQVKKWETLGYPVAPVSINLSPIQFRRKGLVETIRKILSEYELSSSLIVAEITESAFMEDIEFAKTILTGLREMGVAISIDDFGTGYSSLSYLKKLPVNYLKIDISFIRDLDKCSESQAIVSAIITMAKALNLKTIAEGVETKAQYDFLRRLQCDITQGFYFSRPLPAKDCEKLFETAGPL